MRKQAQNRPYLVTLLVNSTIGSITLSWASFFFEMIKEDKTEEVVKVKEVSAKWAPENPNGECKESFRWTKVNSYLGTHGG